MNSAIKTHSYETKAALFEGVGFRNPIFSAGLFRLLAIDHRSLQFFPGWPFAPGKFRRRASVGLHSVPRPLLWNHLSGRRFWRRRQDRKSTLLNSSHVWEFRM